MSSSKEWPETDCTSRRRSGRATSSFLSPSRARIKRCFGYWKLSEGPAASERNIGDPALVEAPRQPAAHRRAAFAVAEDRRNSGLEQQSRSDLRIARGKCHQRAAQLPLPATLLSRAPCGARNGPVSRRRPSARGAAAGIALCRLPRES